MDILNVSAETDRLRETFLRQLFGDEKGFVCIAYASSGKKDFREEFFSWPEDVSNILALVNNVYIGHNVWVCPHLFNTKQRRKEFVKTTPSAWSDLDTCKPELLKVIPTITIESSPGKWQGYWMFERPIDPEEAQNISQRIAYAHADDGADRSGWDLTQLLRFPFTYNYKYLSTPTPIVQISNANRRRYRIDDFEVYDKVEGFEYLDIPFPTEIPDGDELLDKNRLKISPSIWRLYQEELDPKKSWSEPLWQLEMMLFEAGFDTTQVFAIAKEAQCNKYKKRGDSSDVSLWKEVFRAAATHERNTFSLEKRSDYKEKPLLSDEERHIVASQDDTIIERYITWAKGLGDAASQYHQAGAFIALSALLAGSVQLPTSFGMIKPNLWFMILADTTLTRKSTAMDIAMDLVAEIDDNTIMATDGSIEGLLTSLSTRPGKPSVFLRDEFSGLLEMITKKDYYAGMPEFLTKLYDGKMQKRILRKESIDVRDPCLLIFAGGIKNKITSLLTLEHVSSGFMPRFIFITAESDLTRVKPLGPPTSWTDNNKAAVLNELTDLYNFYSAKTNMVIKGSNVSYEVQRKWDAELTPEAWHRYNELETQMLESGMNSQHPEVMTPVGDRLSKSILKAAVLVAAAEQKREDGKVIVEMVHLLRAIAYGEQWKVYSREVIQNIGKSTQEKIYDQMVMFINKHPGISRSRLMQNYRLNAREMSLILETLEQRGQIIRQARGRGEVMFPSSISVSPKELNNGK